MRASIHICHPLPETLPTHNHIPSTYSKTHPTTIFPLNHSLQFIIIIVVVTIARLLHNTHTERLYTRERARDLSRREGLGLRSATTSAACSRLLLLHTSCTGVFAIAVRAPFSHFCTPIFEKNSSDAVRSFGVLTRHRGVSEAVRSEQVALLLLRTSVDCDN